MNQADECGHAKHRKNRQAWAETLDGEHVGHHHSHKANHGTDRQIDSTGNDYERNTNANDGK